MTVTLEHTDADPEAEMARRTKARKRLILPIKDKGGTGASFIVRALAGIHLASRKSSLLLIDGDATVGSLYRYHEDKVEAFSIHGVLDERDRLVNDLLRRGSNLVVCDMPATSLTRFREISRDYNFVDAVTAAGYRLTVIAPITPYDDSLLDFQEVVALLDPDLAADFEAGLEAPRAPARVDYVAVLNLGFAEDRTDFELWDAPDGITRRLLQYAGGVELELPRLRDRIAAKLQKHRLSFSAGEKSENISITDRGRLQRWNVTVETALRQAGDRLGF